MVQIHHLPMWSLLEECLARFLRRPVRGRSSISLLVSKRSSRMGSILSCSNTTPLRTDAHLERGGKATQALSNTTLKREFTCVRTYPCLSCSDVLQGSYSSLTTCRVAVAALEDELIQSHHLRVPEPIRPLRLARHFR